MSFFLDLVKIKKHVLMAGKSKFGGCVAPMPSVSGYDTELVFAVGEDISCLAVTKEVRRIIESNSLVAKVSKIITNHNSTILTTTEGFSFEVETSEGNKFIVASVPCFCGKKNPIEIGTMISFVEI